MQTLRILTEKDVNLIVAKAVGKALVSVEQRIMNELMDRVPTPNGKSLNENDPVEYLALSGSTLALLIEVMEIKTIGQLCAMSYDSLLRYRGFGKAKYIEVATRLAFHGYKLSE